MLSFSKFAVSSLNIWRHAARVTLPQISHILRTRTMQTFSNSWEKDLGKAVNIAKTIRKPIMLVVYRPWCLYCQNLSQQMQTSNKIKELEKYFVMTQINEDDTYLDSRFAPDGGIRYVPRVLFLTPEGEIMKSVMNHKSYKNGTLYVYNDVGDIMESMQSVLKRHVSMGPSDRDERRGSKSREKKEQRPNTRRKTKSKPKGRSTRRSKSSRTKKK